jgi:hypothetical protein
MCLGSSDITLMKRKHNGTLRRTERLEGFTMHVGARELTELIAKTLARSSWQPCGAQPRSTTTKGVRRMWNGYGVARLLAHALVAVCVIGAPITLDVPTMTAQQMRVDKPDKPGKPGGPRGDGCVPVGVTKSPNGIVYADEDCHGVRYRTKMG